MCLSAPALVLFLNLIGPDHVTFGDDRMIVHASHGDAHWVVQTTATDDLWCTLAPQLDRTARFAALTAE